VRLSPTPDQALIRRTARRIALQTAALFTVCLIILAALASGFILRAQNADGQRQLRAAIADDDAVTDPPSGIVIYQSRAGVIRSSPHLQGHPLDPAAFAAVQAKPTTVTGEIKTGGREYQLRTARRGPATVQAGLDLSDQNRERRRMSEALLVAGLVGLLAAIAIGSYIARRAVRPLELASERQRRFVADASHELRTPVTQAHTRAQLLQRSLSASTSQADLADHAHLVDPAHLVEEASRVVRSTRQLGDIIEELLVSAQLSADPASMSRVDLAAVASDAADAEQARADARGITLAVAHDDGPHIVGGSPTALRRVFNSLIDNAFGHVDDGGHITVSIERQGRRRPTIVSSVTDDGHGFDPRDADKLFERFARGNHGDARRFGLGLALAREVIQAHNGTITASAVPGQGATFTITLPTFTEAG
jgi:two-component system OmpR family sensor kinase